MLTVLERTPDFSVGVFDNVSMTIWHHSITVHSIAVSNRAALMAAKAGQPLLMSVVQQVGSPPSEQVRQAMLESIGLTRTTKPLAMAVAIEATGLMAATARSVVSGIFLAGRSNYPSRCFGRGEEVAHWFATFHPDGADFAGVMVHQLSQLRHNPQMRTAAGH